MRLIDADALAEQQKSMHGHGDYEANMYCAEACYGLGNWVWENPEDYGLEAAEKALKAAPTIEAEPVKHGRWEWFEEWSPSTPDHPRECDDCGWRCGECKTALEDMVGGYWDVYDEEPQLNYCPNCGAKMDGGADNAAD